MGLGSDLGKRKNRWEEEGGGGIMSAGPGCKTIATPTSMSTNIRSDAIYQTHHLLSFVISGCYKKKKSLCPSSRTS